MSAKEVLATAMREGTPYPAEVESVVLSALQLMAQEEAGPGAGRLALLHMPVKVRRAERERLRELAETSPRAWTSDDVRFITGLAWAGLDSRHERRIRGPQGLKRPVNADDMRKARARAVDLAQRWKALATHARDYIVSGAFEWRRGFAPYTPETWATAYEETQHVEERQAVREALSAEGKLPEPVSDLAALVAPTDAEGK